MGLSQNGLRVLVPFSNDCEAIDFEIKALGYFEIDGE